MHSDVTVRTAREAELPAVMNILDGAMLAVDDEGVRDRLQESVLVAVEDDRVLGACVLDPRDDGAHVEAIAVRPGRRGQGVGSALVDAAAERRGPLTAEFDADLRPFYESLGFEISESEEPGRYRGTVDSQ